MFTQAVRDSLKRIKPLRKGVRTLKEFGKRQRVAVSIIRGKERTSGQPISVLFAGNRENSNYVANLVFGEAETETQLVRLWRRNLLRYACSTNSNHDLAIIHSDTLPAATQHAGELFRIPCWVGGEKNLDTAAEFARRSEHIKSDVRRIRKNRLDYRVTSEPEEFDRFYHTMYLPYIKGVFGGHAFLMSYEDMQAAIPRCELFLITQDGLDIAGGILVYDNSDCVRGWSLGVKDGDSRWVKAGALAAFEHLQTGYLVEKGYKRLHRGGSRPFLDDGALSFKKNRGMEITDNTRQSFIMLPPRDSTGVRAFLQNNPFIFNDQGILKGAVFFAGDTPPDDAISRLFHDRYIAGLDCLMLFCIGTGHGGRDLPIRTCGHIDSSGVLHVSSASGRKT